jgi:CRISPR-associated protein Cst1
MQLSELNLQIKTGDPFVDAGEMALKYISERFPDKDVMQLIDWAARVYIERWDAKINSLFLNSPITQPAYNTRELRIGKTMERFDEVLSANSELGFCRYCGKKAYLSEVGRDTSCLVGSGKLVNFHHAHEEGLMACSSCITKLFFLPLAVIQIGELVGLLHTATGYGNTYWSEKTIKTNLDKIGRNTSEEILKSEFSNPRNALFHFAVEMVREFENVDVEENFTLYHFTNFGSKVDCDLYSLPHPVFRFVSHALKTCAQDWHDLIRRHFKMTKENVLKEEAFAELYPYYKYFSGSKYDQEREVWRDKDNNVLEETQYMNNYNGIYNRLLSGISILPKLVGYYKKKLKKGGGSVGSDLATIYVMEVLAMTAEQISIIRSIGDKIFALMEQGNDFKKYLTMIERVKKAHELRTVLLRMTKKNYTDGNEEPLVTFDQWVNYLFPDGQYWGEVRDLLLIYLYEKMHHHKLDIEMPDDEIEETEEINEGI